MIQKKFEWINGLTDKVFFAKMVGPKFLGFSPFFMERFARPTREKPRFSKTKINPPVYNPFKILAMLYMIMFSRGIVKSLPRSFARKKAKEARQKSNILVDV